MYQVLNQLLELNKIEAFKNFKLASEGVFYINEKPHITYNAIITPNVEFSGNKNNFNIIDFAQQVEALDFHSDVIADIKMYKTDNDNLQISGLVNIADL